MNNTVNEIKCGYCKGGDISRNQITGKFQCFDCGHYVDNNAKDCFVVLRSTWTRCEQFSNDWRAQMYRLNCTNVCTKFENIPFQTPKYAGKAPQCGQTYLKNDSCSERDNELYVPLPEFFESMMR